MTRWMIVVLLVCVCLSSPALGATTGHDAPFMLAGVMLGMTLSQVLALFPDSGMTVLPETFGRWAEPEAKIMQLPVQHITIAGMHPSRVNVDVSSGRARSITAHFAPPPVPDTSAQLLQAFTQAYGKPTVFGTPGKAGFGFRWNQTGPSPGSEEPRELLLLVPTRATDGPEAHLWYHRPGE